jgi:hypothetical protein
VAGSQLCPRWCEASRAIVPRRSYIDALVAKRMIRRKTAHAEKASLHLQTTSQSCRELSEYPARNLQWYWTHKKAMSGRFFDIEEHAESTRAERSEEWLTELTTRCHSLLDDFRDGIQHVRVAILDTGIDSAHPEIARRIGKYNVIRDVVDFTEGSPRRTFPETGLDKAGHGTHVASLLIRVAPNAGVYVGRICKDTSGINADHVAAVR